jgi:hypothetical protein
VRGARNLSGTALADERELVARGRRVAFTTVAGGVVQGVTVLDLAGDAPAREAHTRLARVASNLSAWLETGAARGLDRVELTFDAPPAVVRLDVADDALVLALGPEGVPAALDLRTLALDTGGADTFGATARRSPRPAPALADVLPGVARAAAGELAGDFAQGVVRAGRAFGDAFRRASRTPALPRPREGFASAPATPTSGAWPPAPLRGPAAAEGEGTWVAALPPFAPPASGLGDGAPPALVETFLRPDPGAPSDVVRLVAFDLRQLELGLEAGFAAPRPSASLHGSGMVPEATRPRVVAVFTAGRPPSADAPGTVVRGRVLAPPVAEAPTLLLGRDAVSFGPWTFGPEIPAFARSVWQPAAPLLVGPGAVVDDRSRADRAGLGRARAGHLVYAFGHDMARSTLARALELAGCDRAYELGARDGHPSFAFVGFAAGQPLPYGVLLDPAMRTDPARLSTSSPDEILFASRRDPRPDVPLPDGLAWAPEAGRQPPPEWLPAVHSATLTTVGVQVHLTAFASGRFRWRVRAGARELVARLGPPFLQTLPDDEPARLGVTFGLGIGKATKRRPARGLGTGGAVGLAMRPEAGVLLAAETGLGVLRSEDVKDLPADADAVELPLTAEDGRLRPEARELGGMRARVALCVLGDGTVLAASTTFDSDEATTGALVDRGCTRVVALDRGAHQASFLHRAGTATPPSPRYDGTALYGVEVPAVGRALAAP